MNLKKYRFLIATLVLGVMSACTDDIDLSEPKSEYPDLSGVPSEITDGYSISFQMSVAPMDGGSPSLTTRATTNQELRDIENFVDLEKLRILFFTCLSDEDYVDEFGKETGEYTTTRKYQTGVHDIFLFEAKSRWVSLVSTAEASDASYQVTTPVFSMGEEDDYDWAKIREILLARPFKIVILVNRPEDIRYSDFDNNPGYGIEEFRFGNKGPYWAKPESESCFQMYELAKKTEFKKIDQQEWNDEISKQGIYHAASINELHHSIWDPVYSNKNSDSNNGNVVGKYNWYDFIMGNPSHKVDQSNNMVNTWIANNRPDAMGAVSAWTKWLKLSEWKAYYPEDQFPVENHQFDDPGKYQHPDGRGYISNPDDKYKPLNFYVLPDQNQGIPMYGVQKFQALGDWKEGTPIHLSAVKPGESTNTKKSTITLLRSLARIELIIPKKMGNKTITVTNPAFMASNVFGRCEPMDVATPTDELWGNHNSSECEWFNIYKYGPVINNNTSAESEDNFLKRMAWFYGAWKPWWDYNNRIAKTSSWFDDAAKNKAGKEMPYPRIYNSCVQRNGTARLDFVQTADDFDSYYHYVVYTGERNINDPSKFNNSSQGMQASRSELAYFRFNVGNDLYCIGINPYNSNSTIRTTYMKVGQDLKNYKSDMAVGTTQNEWNYPIMRNHAYVFRVTQLDNSTQDTDGLNVLVVTSENRTAPDIEYY